MEHTDNNRTYVGENKSDEQISQVGNPISPPIVPPRADETDSLDADAPTTYPSFLNEPLSPDATHFMQDEVLPPVLPPVLPAHSDYQPLDLNEHNTEAISAETDQNPETPVAWVNEPVSVAGDSVAAPVPPDRLHRPSRHPRALVSAARISHPSSQLQAR